MPAARRSATLSPSGPKARGLRLKPGTLAAVAFLFVAALVLAYLGGIMAGRSHWHAPQVEAGDDPAKVIKEAFALNRPVVVDCQIPLDDKVLPMVAPGASINDMMGFIEEPM